MATTGLVTGYIGLILMILLATFFFWIMSMPQEKRENLDFLPFLSEQQKQEFREKMKEAEQRQEQRLEPTSQP